MSSRVRNPDLASEMRTKLRALGLRPTRTRVALSALLFAKGNRHLTAEMLFDEANHAKVPVSLATVYNTLNQFTDVGLLRQVAVDGSKAYFDTNNSEHHHFFIEDKNDLIDIPSSNVVVDKKPVPPEGYEIARIDVVVRLRRKAGSPAPDSPRTRDQSSEQLQPNVSVGRARTPDYLGRFRNSGSFAIFAARRRASSRVSSLAVDRRPGSASK
jgi:Fur family transcriptional regulator, iron response regulator